MILILVIITILVISLLNYSLKKRIIDSGPLDADAVKFLDRLTNSGAQALKWGVVLLFAGLGLVVLEFLRYSALDSLLPYGVEAIFLAVGFLVYYFLTRDKTNN